MQSPAAAAALPSYSFDTPSSLPSTPTYNIMKRKRSPSGLPSPISDVCEDMFEPSMAERIKRRRSLPITPVAAINIAPVTQPKPEPPKVDPIVELRRLQAAGDQAFVQLMIAELEGTVKSKDKTIGVRQAHRLLALLRVATRATQDEGPWLSQREAAASVAPGNFHAGPIFVRDQQPMPRLSVEDFLSEFYDDTAEVFVQDASADAINGTARAVTIGQVKERLRRHDPPTSSWNCLELASPVEDGLRPQFLNDAECRLLTKIKIPLNGARVKAKAGRRALAAGYKEAEKWALLAEAGALTEPHQDSHGYNTYITINEGEVGFGWLHQPTPQERAAWQGNSGLYIGGQWRYVVLRPGHTVYFPAGTVHFVFRLRSGMHTLAFGGHVLRCSTIVQWAEALLIEQSNPYICNEDLTVSVLGFLDQVTKFVTQARTDPDQCYRWGGAVAIDRFLRLKRQFAGKEVKPRSLIVKLPVSPRSTLTGPGLA